MQACSACAALAVILFFFRFVSRVPGHGQFGQMFPYPLLLDKGKNKSGRIETKGGGKARTVPSKL